MVRCILVTESSNLLWIMHLPHSRQEERVQTTTAAMALLFCGKQVETVSNKIELRSSYWL
jgi:hypothetical protein